MGVNSLPKTVTRQHRDCDLNPGPSAPESSTPTTRLPSHLDMWIGSRYYSSAHPINGTGPLCFQVVRPSVRAYMHAYVIAISDRPAVDFYRVGQKTAHQTYGNNSVKS